MTPASPQSRPASVGTAAAGSVVDAAADGFHAAWIAALDELELDVELAESLLRSGDYEAYTERDEWTPPLIPAPLPTDLRDRAVAIRERQLRTSQSLMLAMSGNRRHAALASRMHTGARQERPVFLDRAF